ncbi:hypothetical protein VCRA2112O187_210003 [Vibrio crassostreae]|nr:hypothetical protein VCRA2112O187_210003 [Vibrio crassostreae]
MPEAKAITLPVENFELIPRAITEDE